MNRKISIAGLLALLTAASTAFAQDMTSTTATTAGGVSATTVTYPNGDGPVYSNTTIEFGGMTASITTANSGAVSVNFETNNGASGTPHLGDPGPQYLTLTQTPEGGPAVSYLDSQGQTMVNVPITNPANDDGFDLTANFQSRGTRLMDLDGGSQYRPQLKTQHQEYQKVGSHREWRVTGHHTERVWEGNSENYTEYEVEDGEWVDVDDYDWVWVDDPW